MDQQQEREVAQGLREGRVEAWRALYDAYAGQVWRSVARRMAPEAAEVADVVQETFLAAARGARGFDPARGSLRSWLSGIARRQVALHYRKRDLRRRSEGSGGGVAGREALVEWLECRTESPPAALQSAELRAMVRRALASLPVEQEDLLAARYLDGISTEQIAHAERCSAVAVRSRLARARGAFRRAMLKLAPSADGQAGVCHEG